MFQSAPPVKGASTGAWQAWHVIKVSIRAPREGGVRHGGHIGSELGVSIRAPREGGVHRAASPPAGSACFNPRPP